jgi:alkylhydroperoxidase family enzyme
MDAAFTVAEMTMLSAVVNSTRVNLEAGWNKAEWGPLRRSSNRDLAVPLVTPRIEPVVQAQAPPEIRAMLDPSGSGRDIAAVYRTFAHHPKLYVPRQILSEYIRTKSTLSPRVREMLILRIGWRCRSAYEWAAHAPAGRRGGLSDDQIRMLARSGYEGWSAADAAIVRAADELFTDDTISDSTWKALDDQFDDRQLLEPTILVHIEPGQFHIGHRHHTVEFEARTLDKRIRSQPLDKLLPQRQEHGCIARRVFELRFRQVEIPIAEAFCLVNCLIQVTRGYGFQSMPLFDVAGAHQLAGEQRVENAPEVCSQRVF